MSKHLLYFGIYVTNPSLTYVGPVYGKDTPLFFSIVFIQTYGSYSTFPHERRIRLGLSKESGVVSWNKADDDDGLLKAMHTRSFKHSCFLSCVDTCRRQSSQYELLHCQALCTKYSGKEFFLPYKTGPEPSQCSGILNCNIHIYSCAYCHCLFHATPETVLSVQPQELRCSKYFMN